MTKERTKEWLKEKRSENNLTQRKLAEYSKVNIFTIMNIEQNLRKGSVETWEKLENYFNKKD